MRSAQPDPASCRLRRLQLNASVSIKSIAELGLIIYSENRNIHRMHKSLQKALGFLASPFGLIPYSREQMTCIESGFRCPRCHQSIRGARRYSKNGVKLKFWDMKVSIYLECPKCRYRWKLFRGAPGPVESNKPVGIWDIEIIETVRTEEAIGQDEKIIDNSQSSIGVTRRFEVMKEWSQTFVVDRGKLDTETKQMRIALAENLAIQNKVEAAISERYSVRDEKRQICTEDVTLNIPQNTKSHVVFQWKRIWQHGILSLKCENGAKLEVPFKAAVAVTFDQIQRDE
jgi:hypothetical protein